MNEYATASDNRSQDDEVAGNSVTGRVDILRSQVGKTNALISALADRLGLVTRPDEPKPGPELTATTLRGRLSSPLSEQLETITDEVRDLQRRLDSIHGRIDL